MSLPSALAPHRFGSLLRQTRIEAGLTQESLAERASLGVRSIQGLENGESQPRPETLRRLADALSLSGEVRKRFEVAASPTPRHDGLADPRQRGASPPGQVSTPRTNLPLQLTSFVGREREIAEVRRLLGTTRLLTLTGSWRLREDHASPYEVAADLLDQYSDGVWVVELAALSDPQPRAPERRQCPCPARGLGSAAPRHAPCLPEVERPPASARQLRAPPRRLGAGWPTHCSGTVPRSGSSRRVARRSASTGKRRTASPRSPRPTLARRSPPRARGVRVDSALPRPRTAGHGPGFTLGEGNASAIAQICWRLDGIPLALELAASRTRGLTAEQIASRLDDRFRLLTSGSRTALRRQQTLRAAIDWSYDLLTVEEQAQLRRLSVFVGGWDLEAAETVCSSGEVEAHDVVDLLLLLVDCSLVIADTESQPTRYRLSETIRQYAREKLAESGETAATRTLHRDWYLAIACSGDYPHWFEGDIQLWFDRVELEHDNMRAALEWSQVVDDREAELRLAAEMGWFWRARGYGVEGRTRLATTLERTAGLLPEERVRALGWAARLESQAGNTRRARGFSEEAERIARERGDPSLVVYAQPLRALLEFRLGNTSVALRLLEDTLLVASELGDARRAHLTMVYLGAMLHRLGDDRRARPILESLLKLCRDQGFVSGESDALNWLAAVSISEGEHEGAGKLVKELLAISQSIGYKNATAHGLFYQGDIARARGGWREARGHYLDGLRLMRQAGEYLDGSGSTPSRCRLGRGRGADAPSSSASRGGRRVVQGELHPYAAGRAPGAREGPGSRRRGARRGSLRPRLCRGAGDDARPGRRARAPGPDPAVSKALRGPSRDVPDPQTEALQRLRDQAEDLAVRDVQDVLKTQRVALAAIQSAETGGPVRLDR